MNDCDELKPRVALNRLHVVSNPHQGKARRVLCVCSAGILRSPTMAAVLQQAYGYNTRAVGSEASFALIPVDEVLIAWADEIVFAEKENYAQVAVKFDLSGKEVVVLNVPDCFDYMDPRLVAQIKRKYSDAQK